MKPDYFKNWVTNWEWGARIGLFLMLLSGLVHLGMFVMTQGYLIAYLGAQQEDAVFGIMSTYAGIITALPIQFRFFRFFQIRSCLLVSMMLGIILNCLCLHCQDINLFFAIRFAQGVTASNIIVFTLLLIFTRIRAERVQTIAPAVFYGTMLGNSVLIGLVSGIIVESADWKVTYYYLIMFELLTIIIVLLLLKPSSGHKRYPLYQIDWAGAILFSISALTTAYTVIYGSKYYWFADSRIGFSSTTAVVGSSLFLYRQYMVKRPVIHLSVFKSMNFVSMICLLALYYGIKDSINLVYNYAGGTLRWSILDVIELGLCNIAAMVGVLVICIRLLLAKKVEIKSLLIFGFGLMSVFNLWMCILLTTDLSFRDLLCPILIQGAASGFIFVPVMINVLSSAPANTGMSGLIIAACTRFIATLHSFAGFYNLQLYFNQYFKEGFLGYLTLENQNMISRLDMYRSVYASKGFTTEQASGLAQAAISQSLNQQSQLLTNRSLFMIFGLLSLGIAALLMIIPIIKKWIIDWNKTVLLTQ
ncbi:MFS transporter [Dyadobacter sp. CY356]|uniref:MFS transporter n=1 Tax=Dyadobacter sp. CY356 TaxID=2906442 RepID=UPI001F2B7DD1|nr:MFS transporter [Dyadobacter sp. CY356]MCF0055929.1 hypothetical protein [Dyadobacter sp. CY356]